MGTFESLDSRFDIETVPEVHEVEVIIPKSETQDAIESDVELARITMHGLLAQGEEAVSGILDIAKQSDHPRAYEVAGQLIKTISEVAKDLLEVQKRKKELNKDESGKGPSIQTQNNLFVGSTAELLKALRRHNVEPLSAQE